VIGHASQLLRIHSEFSCHLNMGIRKVELFAGIDPRLEFRRQLLLFRHDITLRKKGSLFPLLFAVILRLLQTDLGLPFAQVTK